jgi:hypothetical protein
MPLITRCMDIPQSTLDHLARLAGRHAEERRSMTEESDNKRVGRAIDLLKHQITWLDIDASSEDERNEFRNLLGIWYARMVQGTPDGPSHTERVYADLLLEEHKASRRGETTEVDRIRHAIAVIENLWPHDCRRWRDRLG